MYYYISIQLNSDLQNTTENVMKYLDFFFLSPGANKPNLPARQDF